MRYLKMKNKLRKKKKKHDNKKKDENSFIKSDGFWQEYDI